MQELLLKMKMNMNSNLNNGANFKNGIHQNQQQQQQQQQQTTTNLSSFGRNTAVNNNHSTGTNLTSPLSPSFPTSNFSLVNRNISTAINAFNHESSSSLSPMHHPSHHHHHHHHQNHRHLANTNNFINSTPI